MKDIKKRLILLWGYVYRLYLKYKLVRVLVWFLVWVWALKPFDNGKILATLFRVVLVLFYRHFFIFPVGQNRKVVNTVLGPPGAGKTSLMAFVALKSRLSGEKVYSNVPIKDTIKFSWEDDFGTYRMENAIVIFDEAGLELDNRDFTTNFKDVYDKKGNLIHNGKNKLIVAKTHRHFGLQMFFCTQGTTGDFDLKLRSLTQNFFLLKKTGFPWLIKIQLFDTTVNVDPLTADFRTERIKKHTYFIFSPVIWFDFVTDDTIDLPEKECWDIYGEN